MSSIKASAFREAGVVVNRWVAIVPAGDKQELSKPGYWAHVATRLHVFDHIEVHAEDGSFWCELLVIACDRTSARVKLVNAADIDVPQDNEESLIEGYKIEFKGAIKRHTVTRLEDNKEISSGFMLRSDAVQFVIMHKQRMAA